MLPGPRIAYNPYRNLQKVVRRSDMILKLLRRKGVLSEGEYRTALAQQPNIAGLQRKVDESLQKEELFDNLTSAVAPELAEEDPQQAPEQSATGESTDTGSPSVAPPPPAEGIEAQPEHSPANPSLPVGEGTE
jgi:monofunctional biosynthetic peptidoglycan transglycosylase